MTESKAKAKNEKIAVIGSGLAGLTVSYLLELNHGFEVTIMERSSAAGLDIASVSISDSNGNEIKVDSPMRGINKLYYPTLFKFYEYLKIPLVSTYSDTCYYQWDALKNENIYMNSNFKKQKNSKRHWIWKLSLFRVIPVIWDMYQSANCKLPFTALLELFRLYLYALNLEATESIGCVDGSLEQWLDSHYFSKDLQIHYVAPVLSSMATCSKKQVLEYPVKVILHMLSKWGSEIQQVQGGVGTVGEKLIRNVSHVKFNCTVVGVWKDKITNKVVVLDQAGNMSHFDKVIFAGPAHVTKALLLESPPNGLKAMQADAETIQALSKFSFLPVRVVVHSDPSVLPQEKKHWRGVNLAVDNQGDCMATLWVNYQHDQTSAKDIFETSNIFVEPEAQISPDKIYSSHIFARSLVTAESNIGIDMLETVQGRNDIFHVGCWCWPGMPLLEGGITSSLRVIERLGLKRPWLPSGDEVSEWSNDDQNHPIVKRTNKGFIHFRLVRDVVISCEFAPVANHTFLNMKEMLTGAGEKSKHNTSNSTTAVHKCYRHTTENAFNNKQEMLLLRERADKLNNPELVEKITNFWKIYQDIRTFAQQPRKKSSSTSQSSFDARTIALAGIITDSCFNELAYLSDSLSRLTKIDFIKELPNGVVNKILNYLDARSLCRCAQVCKIWQESSDSDMIWRRMCSQHIDKMCGKCGWGLPLTTSKRVVSAPVAKGPGKRRRVELDNETLKEYQPKIFQHSEETTATIKIDPLDPISSDDGRTHQTQMMKSWKSIYAERSIVAQNWRKPSFTSKNLIGHTDSIMAMFCQNSLLITASADVTLRAWNTETGVCVAILKGHTGVVRGVQFDKGKIISCSMDKTIRIWSLKSFECVRVIEGHTSGVVSIHFIDRFLASGSVDGIVRVWNLEAGTSFTLVGHESWVNKVQILNCKTRLLSCSDDSTIILWDITNKTPIRHFVGHSGPVQSLGLLKPIHIHGVPDMKRFLTASLDNTIKLWDLDSGKVLSTLFGHTEGVWGVHADQIRIVSASQDKKLKVWDQHSGNCLYTLTSHHSPVRSVWLSDTLLISGDAEGIVTVRDYCPLVV